MDLRREVDATAVDPLERLRGDEATLADDVSRARASAEAEVEAARREAERLAAEARAGAEAEREVERASAEAALRREAEAAEAAREVERAALCARAAARHAEAVARALALVLGEAP
ncbi:MAG: hypothetical protein QM704_15905 [Anaeromyxobacteraceae bacterium]